MLTIRRLAREQCKKDDNKLDEYLQQVTIHRSYIRHDVAPY